MSRKRQLEKFLKKWGLEQADRIREEEQRARAAMYAASPEGQADRIMKQNNMSTEEVFMIITQSGVPIITQMWANSVSRAIEETLEKFLESDRFKQIIEAVVQEQIVQAANGVLKGLQAYGQQMVDEAIERVKKETQKAVMDNVIYLFGDVEKHNKEPKKASKRGEIPMKKWGKKMAIDWKEAKRREIGEDTVVFWLLEEAEEKGVNINVGNQVVKNGYASAYQKGIKLFGTWEEAVNAYRKWKMN